MLEIKGQLPHQLTWEERHPSNYSFTKIEVSQFLPKKSNTNTKRTVGKSNGRKRET